MKALRILLFASIWSAIAASQHASATVINGPFVPGSGSWTLLPNGDFETGDATGFSLHVSHPSLFGNPVTADAANAYEGNYAGALTYVSGEAYYGIAIAGDAVTLPVGGDYVLSGFVRAAVSDSGVTGRMDRFGASSETYFDTSNTDWQFVYEEFTNLSGFWYPRFHMGRSLAHLMTSGDTFYIDEFALTPAGEFQPPALQTTGVPDAGGTLGLLSFGLAMLAFARRGGK